MGHKKEEGTYHSMDKLMKEMHEFLLISEYSGINKEQRIYDRSKTAHSNPLVKCFLTKSKRSIK